MLLKKQITVKMSAINYLAGFLKHLSNFRISKFALVDNKSKIHKYAKLYRKTKIVSSEIEAYSYVAPGTELTHAKIGKFCSVGRACLIGLPSHPIHNISTSPLFTSKKNGTNFSWTRNNIFQEFDPVTIGNDVWIGSRVIIIGGVNIGDGAVIGAGAIITKDIPAYAVAVGVPAKVIKYRFSPDIIKELQKIKWWDFPEGKLKNNISQFQRKSLLVEDVKKLTIVKNNKHV